MVQELQNEMLKQSIGYGIHSHNGEYLGEIIEVRSNGNEKPGYMILKSDVCFGRGKRFFAVPVTSSLIKVNEHGKIMLAVHKDDLQFAKGISADKLPKPNLNFSKNIFELYKYKLPETP